MRIAGGSKENGVFAAQTVQSVLRHHGAMLAKIVSAPVEILELEAKGAAAKRLHDLPSGRHNFLADSISRYGGDPIGLHVFLISRGS